MTETDFSGVYLNADNAKQGDIVEIIGEGEYEKKERDGKSITIFNMPVRINGKDKIYSPGMESGKRLQKAFGNDSKNWVGKKFAVQIVNYKSFGCV